MKIEILGTGCPKCKRVEENAKRALRELRIDAKIEKVTDILKITERITIPPAIAINGEIKTEGRIPEVEEIKKWLK